MRLDTRWKGKRVLVLGLARSGTEAAKLLLQLGAEVTVNDQGEETESASRLREMGADVICGSHPESLVHESVDALIKNPGIRYDHPLVEKAQALQIPVLTEIQPAWDASDSHAIAVTGSNGKTTTTTLIWEMLKNSALTPKLAGNIGFPASEVVRSSGTTDALVMELSSFQLMGTDTFHPGTAVLLNLMDAHLDYHGTREAYHDAKAEIFRRQTENDLLIYNLDDDDVVQLTRNASGRKAAFSLKKEVPEGADLRQDGLYVKGEKLISREEFALPGEYNIANALAAALAAVENGADMERIRHVLKTFSGVEHRLQEVGEWEGRTFYNNSKATNSAAAITSLEAFDDPVVWICGGLDRGQSFDELIPYMKRVKAVAAYGETKEKLAEMARRAGVQTVSVNETLPKAVEKAVAASTAGDVILLSPACASWDQFKTFEERGALFVETVQQWIERRDAE
ncbi:UDP-N-acetylmuramoyl-L-alanine--D-glutamate ligase [Alkalicoccus urumqiensis]|uniref:UDP-N-acetylmuramoylalanine--D-glutamate ligase n=1 Tax=Alkalicoccus urumqiensis TaxID=1548213 RepID=A0A2P6MG93_ALKUR|nr:UDP-N-acetylmuramoyl-L-alanine--D-glutamate ligase [Alkalicoccus urumqiensis]PRO65315.1 UDP-N-acetylmuramoyl-L-alanine--D-glutamate ligase [Alkalicoccus urumqiensis]